MQVPLIINEDGQVTSSGQDRALKIKADREGRHFVSLVRIDLHLWMNGPLSLSFFPLIEGWLHFGGVSSFDTRRDWKEGQEEGKESFKERKTNCKGLVFDCH